MPQQNINALYIGHSLVNTTMPAMIEQIANQPGDTGVGNGVDYQVINGSPLAYNWSNSHQAEGVDARQVLPSGDYNALIMTEAIPLDEHIRWSNPSANALNFFELAYEGNPDVQTYFYETWHPMGSGDAGVEAWAQAVRDDLPKWESIVDGVNEGRPEGSNPMLMVGAGQALLKLHEAIEAGDVPGINSIRELFADDIHMNDLGNYYVSMVQYSTVWQAEPTDVPTTLTNAWGNVILEVDPELAAVMQDIAWESVTSYEGSGVTAGPVDPDPVDPVDPDPVDPVDPDPVDPVDPDPVDPVDPDPVDPVDPDPVDPVDPDPVDPVDPDPVDPVDPDPVDPVDPDPVDPDPVDPVDPDPVDPVDPDPVDPVDPDPVDPVDPDPVDPVDPDPVDPDPVDPVDPDPVDPDPVDPVDPDPVDPVDPDPVDPVDPDPVDPVDPDPVDPDPVDPDPVDPVDPDPVDPVDPDPVDPDPVDPVDPDPVDPDPVDPVDPDTPVDGQVLTGTGLADNLFAGEGDDIVFGLEGNDNIDGAGGHDILDGGEGDDAIAGGAGDDRIIGGDGNDGITGGTGDDILEGGSGEDLFTFVDGDGYDQITDFNRQEDAIYINGRYVDLDNNTADDVYVFRALNGTYIIGYNGGDDVIDVTVVDGDPDQVVDGTHKSEVLEGGGGNDTISAFEGNDTVFAGEGDDVIYGDSGRNVLHGEEGDDIISSGTGSSVLVGGEGDDTLLLNSRHGADHKATGGEGADVFDVSGGSTSFFRPLYNPSKSTITDFEVGVDSLMVNGLEITSNTGFWDSIKKGITFWEDRDGDMVVMFNMTDRVTLEDVSLDDFFG